MALFDRARTDHGPAEYGQSAAASYERQCLTHMIRFCPHNGAVES
jgi:hypothetical protein